MGSVIVAGGGGGGVDVPPGDVDPVGGTTFCPPTRVSFTVSATARPRVEARIESEPWPRFSVYFACTVLDL